MGLQRRSPAPSRHVTPQAALAHAPQDKCFLHLEAPVQRVCGWDTPFPLAFEDFYLPDQHRCFEAIKAAITF